MEISTENRLILLRAVTKWSCSLNHKMNIYLFGSQITGKATIDSDVDIFVEFPDIKDPTKIWVDAHDCWENCLSLKTSLNIDLHLYEEDNDIVTKDMKHEHLFSSNYWLP